ncbi:MAG: FAD-binding protein [Coriobacteriia bacterium]|nr:FAD-binding protein [Coriobacteriia bacterium]
MSKERVGEAQGINRRSFLKGAAAVSAAAAITAVLPGCSKKADAAFVDTVTWDRETEVLVVGFGGSGTVSAVEAHEAGAQVLIIEKAPIEGGGTSRTSGGFITIVNDEKSIDGAVQYMNTAARGLTPEAVYKAWATEGTKTKDWLTKHGIIFVPMTGRGADFANWPGASSLGCVCITDKEGGASNLGGGVFSKWARQYVADQKIDVLYDTRATDLIQDPTTKEVVGVYATSAGKQIAIKAKKAVILASGGFEFNDDMLGNYMRPYPLACVGWPYNTGDGQKMAEKIGADLWHMNLPCAHGFTFVEPKSNLGRWGAGVKGASYIFIERSGKRFASENPNVFFGHRSFMAFDMWDQSSTWIDSAYEYIPFYIIFDEKARTAGPLFAKTTIGSTTIPTQLGGQAEWSADNSTEIANGWILKANTIKELAALIPENWKLSGDTLAATVAEYNATCAAGVDTKWGRPAVASSKPNLVALDTPPYYAIKMQPSLYSTCGGPRKNEKAQVLDIAGNVIPRFYVSGVCGHSAAHVYSCFGQNWAEIMNFGRISGRNAAAETVLAPASA